MSGGVMVRQEQPQHRSRGDKESQLDRNDQEWNPASGSQEPAVLLSPGLAMGDEGKNRVGQGVADVEAGPGEKAAGLVAPEYPRRHPGRLREHPQAQQGR